MTDRPTPPNPEDAPQPERQRGGADPMEWLQSPARRQSQPPAEQSEQARSDQSDEAASADATPEAAPSRPTNPFSRFGRSATPPPPLAASGSAAARSFTPPSFGTRPLGNPPSPAAETPENTPPRPFGLFGGLFGQRPTPRPNTDSQSVQDQDAAAEMLAHLTQTLQNHEQHSPAIVRHALSGLGKVGRADEHLVLVAHFLDAAWEQSVRLAGVSAIGSLGGETAIDTLIGLLNDPDIVIRWEAQEALDRLLSAPEDQAQPPLKKAEAPPAAPQAEGDSSVDVISSFADEDIPF